MKRAIFIITLLFLMSVSPVYAAKEIVNEDFNSPSSDFTYNGKAYRDDSLGMVNLSPCCYNGSVFYNYPVNTAHLRAEFDFRIERLDSQGADGFTFALIDSLDPNYLGGGGGGLGYSQTPPGQIGGFAIEFDIHKNNEESDGNHIALMIAGDRLNATYLTGDIPVLEDNGTFHTEIYIRGGKHLEVYLANDSIGYPRTKVVAYTIPNMKPFKGLAGFTGGVGLFRALFYVDNFRLYR